MSNTPSTWTAHSRQTVNDQVSALLNGVVVPQDATSNVRCDLIQACAHIAANLICDLVARLPESNKEVLMGEAVRGIACLNKDMVAHIIQRFSTSH